MSERTNIQWCDSTVNPIMGCAGCELYPSAEQILGRIDRQLMKAADRWSRGQAIELFEEVLAKAYTQLRRDIGKPGVGHLNEVSTTNLRHLRHEFRSVVTERASAEAGKIAIHVIESSLKCYAAQLHGNRGYNIASPTRRSNSGYAPTFEQLTQYEGRIAAATRWPDLRGTRRAEKPWLDLLPRLIFVSDMGDAFSSEDDFDFLQRETEAFQSDAGKQHLWLWLSKRPSTMRRFAKRLGGFPANVCAMTTVTSTKQLRRVEQLKRVDAPVRGLSIEPLWDSVAERIDLAGIDWVIVGGESGAQANVQPFQVEWALALRDRCQQAGVAFFVKQLGRRPVYRAAELLLDNSHGGDWTEWPSEIKVREMPQRFLTET